MEWINSVSTSIEKLFGRDGNEGEGGRGSSEDGEDGGIWGRGRGGMGQEEGGWGTAAGTGDGLKGVLRPSSTEFVGRTGSTDRSVNGAAPFRTSSAGSFGRVPSVTSAASSAPSSRAAESAEVKQLSLHERCELLAAVNHSLIKHIHKAGWRHGKDSEAEAVAARTELDNGWWVVEGWQDADPKQMHVTCSRQDVHVSRVTSNGANLQSVSVEGEAKFVCVEECNRVALSIELATKAILLLHCTQCILFIGGSVPNMTLRDCINVEIVMGDASAAGEIETIGCYGITVTTIPQGKHTYLKPSQLQESTYRNSVYIPERLTTALAHGNIYTTCGGTKNLANQGHITMSHIQ